MPTSPRITFRLPPELQALVSDSVRHGRHVSDIIREALEAYFGLRPTPRPTVSDTGVHVSDSVSDTMSDMSTKLSDVVSDVSDMRTRLAALEARLEELSSGVGQRLTERPTPAPVPATPKPVQQARRVEALPDHIKSIAEFAALYDKLSLGELAQLLYDRHIWRSKDHQTGEEKPVHRGTLKKWLDQAREAGEL